MAVFSFSRTFTALLSTILLCSTLSPIFQVAAAPWPSDAKIGTHRTRYLGRRGVKVEAYNPASTFKTFGAASTLSLPSITKSHLTGRSTSPSNASEAQEHPEWSATAMSFVASNFGVKEPELAWRSGYLHEEAGDGVAFMRQAHNGIPFANAVANAAFTHGKLVSYGSSFVDLSSATIAPSTPTISWRSVLPRVEEELDAQYNGEDATLEYYVKADGSVALAHGVQLQSDRGAYLEAFIDAHTGELLSVTDFLAHSYSSYNVLPIAKAGFDEGTEVLHDPEDWGVSPLGWRNMSSALDTLSTSGNNVLAFGGRNYERPMVTADELAAAGGRRVFGAQYDATLAPSAPTNLAAATTNAFYMMNTLHDVTYRYGFTESTFNFQLNNFGKGGQGGNRLVVSVQDASHANDDDEGVLNNNAIFATPPDGRPPRCDLLVWDQAGSAVHRDGAMQNVIIIHEFAHGVTNRMTGGGTGRCLQTEEAGALGEGWRDMLADWLSQTSVDTKDFVIGAYVSGRPQGIRSYPYSVNRDTNPLTYQSLRVRHGVHDMGEVWATILHAVYAELVARYGFSSDKLTNADGGAGNVVFLRLYTDALLLQPCNPKFIQARDAIIQADENRYGGEHRCALYRGFASRGMGVGASTRFVDNAGVPEDCY